MICHGLVARIFQHEIDHMNGELMEDKAIKFQSIPEIADDNEFEKFY